mmetsp:Transcript_811/g.1625  ORF Transcript_811/g.1625 Transcript_811/m.1625 type:complete len:276 (+) Transcript_811:363-1190(+)
MAASTLASSATFNAPSRVNSQILLTPCCQPRLIAPSSDSSSAAPLSSRNAPAADVRSGALASARTRARYASSALPSNGWTHESMAQHLTPPSAVGSRITLPRLPSVANSTGRRSALLNNTSTAAIRPSASNSPSLSAVALTLCSSVGPRTNSRTATGSARALPTSTATRRAERLALKAASCSAATLFGIPAICRRSARDQYNPPFVKKSGMLQQPDVHSNVAMRFGSISSSTSDCVARRAAGTRTPTARMMSAARSSWFAFTIRTSKGFTHSDLA